MRCGNGHVQMQRDGFSCKPGPLVNPVMISRELFDGACASDGKAFAFSRLEPEFRGEPQIVEQERDIECFVIDGLPPVLEARKKIGAQTMIEELSLAGLEGERLRRFADRAVWRQNLIRFKVADSFDRSA